MTDADTSTDGNGTEPDGAIDRSFDAAERSYRERVDDALADIPTDPAETGVAFDVLTRQPLIVVDESAASVAAYYRREDFCLMTYGLHPYLGVRADEPVYECVFLPDDVEKAADLGKTYDYPRSRLCTVPIGLAGTDRDVPTV